MVTALHRWASQGVDQNYPSIKVGGVLHFPPVGRGPAFSWVAIFHLAYAPGENEGGAQDCLSPFYSW